MLISAHAIRSLQVCNYGYLFLILLGIIPDFIVIPTINELINNKDVQLNYAIKLATKE